MVKMASLERGWDGKKIKWKLSEVNTRAVSRGKNKYIKIQLKI